MKPQALHFAAQAVMSGSMDLVIAAGVESMTRVPMFSPNALAAKAGLGSSVSPAMQARYPGVAFSQFSGAEAMARKYGLQRSALDAYAWASHQRAAAATRAGAFDDEVLPIKVRGDDGEVGCDLHRIDEGIRLDGSLQGIAGVKPLQDGGCISAANASQLCDGASGVLVASRHGLERLGIAPLARIHHLSVLGHDPVIMLEAPIPATERALQRAGLRIDDIDLFEVNEAFASVPLAWLQGLRRRPGAAQRAWRGDRARSPAWRFRHPADDHARACAAAPRRALWPADHVRRRRQGQCHDRRTPLSGGAERP